MLTSSRVDMSGNTTFIADCEVVVYSVIFLESGVIACVKDDNCNPLRTYYWLALDVKAVTGTIYGE